MALLVHRCRLDAAPDVAPPRGSPGESGRVGNAEALAEWRGPSRAHRPERTAGTHARCRRRPTLAIAVSRVARPRAGGPAPHRATHRRGVVPGHAWAEAHGLRGPPRRRRRLVHRVDEAMRPLPVPISRRPAGRRPQPGVVFRRDLLDAAELCELARSECVLPVRAALRRGAPRPAPAGRRSGGRHGPGGRAHRARVSVLAYLDHRRGWRGVGQARRRPPCPSAGRSRRWRPASAWSGCSMLACPRRCATSTSSTRTGASSADPTCWTRSPAWWWSTTGATTSRPGAGAATSRARSASALPVSSTCRSSGRPRCVTERAWSGGCMPSDGARRSRHPSTGGGRCDPRVSTCRRLRRPGSEFA